MRPWDVGRLGWKEVIEVKCWLFAFSQETSENV